jgi:hypothetical protein
MRLVGLFLKCERKKFCGFRKIGNIFCPDVLSNRTLRHLNAQSVWRNGIEGQCHNLFEGNRWSRRLLRPTVDDDVDLRLAKCSDGRAEPPQPTPCRHQRQETLDRKRAGYRISRTSVVPKISSSTEFTRSATLSETKETIRNGKQLQQQSTWPLSSNRCGPFSI